MQSDFQLISESLGLASYKGTRFLDMQGLEVQLHIHIEDFQGAFKVNSVQHRQLLVQYELHSFLNMEAFGEGHFFLEPVGLGIHYNHGFNPK